MKLRYLFLGLAIAVIGIITTAKWRGHRFAQPPFEIFPDMNYQDKVKDQQPSAFFADGRVDRFAHEACALGRILAKHVFGIPKAVSVKIIF